MESAAVFACEGDELISVLHLPESRPQPVGILIVVGGPQYRVGSHRQFVLTARCLASDGYPVLRFDYRGMGDSSGSARDFEGVGDDLRRAIDHFFEVVPSLRGVVVFGLCDAASAALMYCRTDERVKGLILVNPWVRTEAGEAQAFVKHYYGQRLLQRSFWAKAIKGELHLLDSCRSFFRAVVKARVAGLPDARAAGNFVDRMRQGLQAFGGPILLLISDRDLTAKEFVDRCRNVPDWVSGSSRPGVQWVTIGDADHTFSSSAALDQANGAILAWLAQAADGFCD